MLPVSLLTTRNKVVSLTIDKPLELLGRNYYTNDKIKYLVYGNKTELQCQICWKVLLFVFAGAHSCCPDFLVQILIEEGKSIYLTHSPAVGSGEEGWMEPVPGVFVLLRHSEEKFHIKSEFSSTRGYHLVGYDVYDVNWRHLTCHLASVILHFTALSKGEEIREFNTKSSQNAYENYRLV